MKAILGLILAAVAATAQAEPSACAYNLKTDIQLGRAIDDLVHPYDRTNNFSGVVVVGKGETVLVQRVYGLANVELGVANQLDSMFHIASVSKPFTAAAILALVQDGKLTVDDPLSKFLPDYPRGNEILVRHLLTHSSGIVDINGLPEYQVLMRSPVTIEQLIAAFKDKPLRFAPGTKTSYSNSNYNLLARIVEIASGQTFASILKQRIFVGLPSLASDDDPQKIVPNRASGYVPVGKDQVANAPYLDWRAKTGNGSLMTTAQDLYRWTCSYHRGMVIGSKLVEQSRTAQIDKYGFGWAVGGTADDRQVEATGRSPGFTSAVEYFPATQLTVIVLANSYSSLSQGLADDIANLARGKTVAPLLPSDLVSTDPAALARAVGDYQFGKDFYSPSMTATLRRDGTDLWMDTSSGDKIYLIPVTKDTWVDRLYGGKVKVESATGDHPKSLTWSFGKDFRAPEVKK